MFFSGNSDTKHRIIASFLSAHVLTDSGQLGLCDNINLFIMKKTEFKKRQKS